MEYIEDLSYSNIVKLVQNEEIKGADLLNTCAIEMEELKSELYKLENKITKVKNRHNTLFRASLDIAKHLEKKLPLIVQRDRYVVILSKEDMTIDRNVI